MRHAAFIENAECFDAMAFGISGAEAMSKHGVHMKMCGEMS